MERKDIRKYVDELNEYLKGFAEKTGLTIKINSTSYTKDDFTCKINFTTLNQEENYSKKAVFSNIPFGTKISYRGDIYTVVDYKPRATKYPYIVENVNGKRFKVDSNWINQFKAV